MLIIDLYSAQHIWVQLVAKFQNKYSQHFLQDINYSYNYKHYKLMKIC